MPGDLAKTILIIPCSAGKKGTRQHTFQELSITDFLNREASQLLHEGRRLAFEKTRVDATSDPKPALALYSGQPYATPGVIEGLQETIRRGLHVLIVSGGYGLCRAEEPIHDYEAPIQKTMSVWRKRVPQILHDYVVRNSIRRTFGTFSTQYAALIPNHPAEEDWRSVPNFDDLRGAGAAMRAVPQAVGRTLLELLRNDLNPSGNWARS